MAIQINGSDRFHAPHLPAWFARPFYPPGYRYPLHKHTFGEVFWVCQGTIRHRVGGRDELLHAGEVRFIHPDTAHALAADECSAIIGNLAFPATVLAQLTPLAGQLPFIAGKAPGGQLAPAGRAALDAWSDRLASRHINLLDVGAFVLWLMSELRRPVEPDTRDAPAWLNQALVDLDHPERLATGARGLCASTGQTPRILAKEVRARFGSTVIQFINRRRIAWLAHQLHAGDEPIPLLAQRCGLSNLSHCYQLFRETYGCPPGEYRRQSAAS